MAMKLLDLPAYRCLLADCGGGSFRKIVLTAAIALWIEEAKIENPEALQLRVDVDTSDHPDAGNHCMGVAAPLSSYHFNEMGMSLVEHRVVKE